MVCFGPTWKEKSFWKVGVSLVAYLTSFLSFLLPKRTPVLLKYLLNFHSAQVCQVTLRPPTAPRVGVTGLLKFIKDGTWWNLIQWHVDIIRRIFLESSSLLFWERLQKCRFLFLLDNMCFTNIGHRTIAAISRPIWGGSQQVHEGEAKLTVGKWSRASRLKQTEACPTSGFPVF